MRTITCKVPDRLNAALEAASREDRISKSELVREALEAMVKRRNGKRAMRAIDLAGHLCGSVKLPRDLLTSPKYMEDFGA